MSQPARLFQRLRFWIFVAVLSATAPLGLRAQNNADPVLTAADFQTGESVALDKRAWKYRAGDDRAWAAPDFDDSDWKTVSNEQINRAPSAALENWQGRGWFRMRVAVDESLVNQPLALRVWHWGASEIFVDGAAIARFGEIAPGAGDREFNPRGQMISVVFERAGVHTIAVRYSFYAGRDLQNGWGRWLAAGDFLPGFLLAAQRADAAALAIETRAVANRFDYLFVGLLFALAFVHLLLFAFYPAARGNLFYSFFDVAIGITVLLNRLLNDGHFAATTAAMLDILRQAVQSVGLMSLLMFLYVEFAGKRVSRFYWVLSALWLVSIALLAAHVPQPFPYHLVLLALTLADCVRIIALALVRRLPGAWTLAAGVGVLVVGVANNIAFERDLHFLPEWLYEINLYTAIFAVPVAVSIYLARDFARTNKNLAAQLEREVEHEKERARLQIVEAENERRAKELEEARQLQLSMLPKKLPELPNLEIAAYMKPATEVGGDYYDFHRSKDGTLTVAVGDATGHGLKAGTVVAAAKGLFNALAGDAESIADFFRQTSLALKRMNMRSLFMAMAIVKIENSRFLIGGAGMPEALLYRRATAEIEEISLKGAPLGSVTTFPYREQAFDLTAGDCLLLMSDGFPEMFDPAGEMFETERAKQTFAETAERDAQTIINRLVAAGEQWAGGRALDDDVTLLVIKVKASKDLNS